jgi:DNA-binding NarL/FixJ family response regulator
MLEPEYAVVGIVTDGYELVDAALTLKPDIIVLDASLPRLDGLNAGGQIKQKLRTVKLVFLTTTLNPELAAEAFRRDASACMPKQAKWEELLTAIRMVNRGSSYLSALIAKDMVNFLLSSKPSSPRALTQRQSEILGLLVEGMSMKQVADQIQVKTGTVAFHKYKMMETLHIKTNAELLGYAIKQEQLYA